MSLGQWSVCVPLASGWSHVDREIYKVEPRRMPSYSRVSYHQKGPRTRKCRIAFVSWRHRYHGGLPLIGNGPKDTDSTPVMPCYYSPGLPVFGVYYSLSDVGGAAA